MRTTTGRETFRVTSVWLIRKQALPLRALFDRDGANACASSPVEGPYIRSQGGYGDNLVVHRAPTREHASGAVGASAVAR